MRELLIKVQAIKIPSEQAKVPPIDHVNPNPVSVEESVPDGGFEEEIVLGTEDEVEMILPSVPSHQSPLFVKALQDSSPYYDKLRKKRPLFPVTTSLKCETHPFFEGHSNI